MDFGCPLQVTLMEASHSSHAAKLLHAKARPPQLLHCISFPKNHPPCSRHLTAISDSTAPLDSRVQKGDVHQSSARKINESDLPW